MKKSIFMILMFCIITASTFAQIDLDKMSDDELIALQQRIKETLAMREQQKQTADMEYSDRIIIPEECLLFDTDFWGTGLIITGTENWKEEWSDKVLEVPTTIQGFPITEIGSMAFGYSCRCKGIYIPDGIHLNSDAFWNFGGKFVRLPNTLETIPQNAFFESYIETIVIPESVKEISNKAFYECTNLKSIIIPESVGKICSEAFAGSGIESLVLPKKLDFGEKAFSNCDNLENVEIPDDISYTYTINYNRRYTSSVYLNSYINGAKIDKNLSLKMKLKQIELECLVELYDDGGK